MNPKDKPIFNALTDDEAAILTIYGEARNQGLEGKQAIGVVIRNRAKGGKSIKDIVYAPNQFSCYLSADPNYPKLLEVAANFHEALKLNQALGECRDAWWSSNASFEAMLDGATFYEVQGTKNEWFDKEVEAGTLVKTCRIGAHDFYKEVRA